MLFNSNNGKMKITVNSILGINEVRIVVINSEGIERSFNLNETTFNAMKKTLMNCANIEVFSNLILSNGGNRHCEPLFVRI